MYRNVRCRLTPLEEPKELVPVQSTVLREGNEVVLVEFQERKQNEICKTNLNPNVVTVQALLDSGQTIQGNVSLDVTDPIDMEERAEAVAQQLLNNIQNQES